jgi:uncharacterized protein (DUF427 family)
MTKAIWGGRVVAESNETIRIEGNHYFPPASVQKEFLTDSDTHTTCPWKGEANYYHVVVDGQTNEDGAWYYPTPKAGSIKRVGKDFTNYIAFWHGVGIEE